MFKDFFSKEMSIIIVSTFPSFPIRLSFLLLQFKSKVEFSGLLLSCQRPWGRRSLISLNSFFLLPLEHNSLTGFLLPLWLLFFSPLCWSVLIFLMFPCWSIPGINPANFFIPEMEIPCFQFLRPLSSGLFQQSVQTRGTDHWPMPTHPLDAWGLFVAVHSAWASSGCSARGEVGSNCDGVWRKRQLNQGQWETPQGGMFNLPSASSFSTSFSVPYPSSSVLWMDSLHTCCEFISESLQHSHHCLEQNGICWMNRWRFFFKDPFLPKASSPKVLFWWKRQKRLGWND